MDPVLNGFTDELVKIAAGTPGLTQRLAITGALGSGAYHGASRVKAGLTGDYGPEGTAMGALGKGAAGGLLLSLILRALGRMNR